MWIIKSNKRKKIEMLNKLAQFIAFVAFMVAFSYMALGAMAKEADFNDNLRNSRCMSEEPLPGYCDNANGDV